MLLSQGQGLISLSPLNSRSRVVGEQCLEGRQPGQRKGSHQRGTWPLAGLVSDTA